MRFCYRSISKNGNGGTKLSSVTPYTSLETTIYKAVTYAFSQVLGTTVAPVAPFKTCFSLKSFDFARVGPAVPHIELMYKERMVDYGRKLDPTQW